MKERTSETPFTGAFPIPALVMNFSVTTMPVLTGKQKKGV
jgi:hypothetical protein